jgi:hypothetical protein
MDHFFLSRLAEDPESGSQIFAKGGATDVISFLSPTLEIISSSSSSSSSSQDLPGLLNSVLVGGAGLNQLNGTYIYVTEFEGKPYYYKSENPSLFILWYENQWEIYDFDLDGLPIYTGNENVLYPWNVTVWQTSNPIYNPVPTVTKLL